MLASQLCDPICTHARCQSRRKNVKPCLGIAMVEHNSEARHAQTEGRSNIRKKHCRSACPCSTLSPRCQQLRVIRTGGSSFHRFNLVGKRLAWHCHYLLPLPVGDIGRDRRSLMLATGTLCHSDRLPC